MSLRTCGDCTTVMMMGDRSYEKSTKGSLTSVAVSLLGAAPFCPERPSVYSLTLYWLVSSR
jgi:hypothetical protein